MSLGTISIGLERLMVHQSSGKRRPAIYYKPQMEEHLRARTIVSAPATTVPLLRSTARYKRPGFPAVTTTYQVE